MSAMSLRSVLCWSGLAAAALAASSCYSFSPSGEACTISCDGTACPDGLVCNPNGKCGATASTCMGGGGVDASGIVDGNGGPDGRPAATGFLELETGHEHACGIAADHEMYCWGSNASGQLVGIVTPGDANATRPLRFRPDGAASMWHGLSAGQAHTCALRENGDDDELWCWGSNYTGQVSAGPGDDVLVHQIPTQEGAAWVQVAAGADFTCALNALGHVWCWGDNTLAQHGDSQFDNAGNPRTAPTKAALGAIIPDELAAGDRFACVRASDTVACWGADDREQTGGTETCRDGVACTKQPRLMAVSGAQGLALGGVHGCVRKALGIECWGAGDSQMRGTADGADTASPSQVATTAGITYTDLSVGSGRACAVADDGSVICWGGYDNALGQRGIGSQYSVANLRPPTTVTDLTAFHVAVGGDFACALAGTDAVVGGAPQCWGRNHAGQIGDGTEAIVRVPQQVDKPADAIGDWLEVRAGRDFTCAIIGNAVAANRKVYCWGRDNRRQATGAGGAIDVARPGPAIQFGAMPLTDARGLVVGDSHACVVAKAGGAIENVYCWGDDSQGQLGNGAAVASNVVQLPLVDTGALATTTPLVAGANQTCATNGGASFDWRCWGQGVYDGEGLNYPVVASPVPQPLLATAPGLSIGINFQCKNMAGGNDEVQCRGTNVDGQTGRGSLAGSPSPAGFADVDFVDSTESDPVMSVGTSSHRCGFFGDFGGNEPLMCWGHNPWGQVGVDPLAEQVPTPAVLDGGESPAIAPVDSAVGLNHTCYVRANGNLLCLGNNEQGQLGVALGAASTYVPQAVAGSWHRVTAGAYHTCALSSDATPTLSCWGANEFGETGTGNSNRLAPTAVLAP